MRTREIMIKNLKEEIEHLRSERRIIWNLIEMNNKKFGPDMAYRAQCHFDRTLDHIQSEIDIKFSRICDLEKKILEKSEKQ